MGKRMAAMCCLQASAAFCIVQGGCTQPGKAVAREGGQPAHPVRTIALFPWTSYCTDAIGMLLEEKGYKTFGGRRPSADHLLIGDDEDDKAMTSPEQLARFRDAGIDAIIMNSAEPTEAGDKLVMRARMVSTHDAKVLADVSLEAFTSEMGTSPDDPQTSRFLWSSARTLTQALLDKAELQ